jgi:hypothetical protein
MTDRPCSVRPEARAVLAVAPALVLGVAFLQAHVQQHLRVGPGELVVLRLEQRVQRAAEDLPALEAVQALRAVGPVGHAAVGVEEEDGVVADGVRHQAKALLAGVQLGAALGHAFFQVQVGVEDEVLGAAPLGDVEEFDEEAVHRAVVAVGQVVHLEVVRRAVGAGALGLVAQRFAVERLGHARQHLGQHLG